MHVDMDAFYASVELRRRPELRGTPVIVGGSPRGVVLSASYEARARGVRSGMPRRRPAGWPRRRPSSSPDFDTYTAVSKAIVAVFRSVTSVVEAASIDEAYLDLTGSVRMFGPPAHDRRVRPGGGRRRAADHLLGRASGRPSSSPRSPPGRPSRTGWSRCRRTGSRRSCIRCRWRRCGGSGRRPRRSCTGWGCSRSATWRTPRAAPCAATFGPHAGADAGRAGLGPGPAPGGAAGARAQRRLAGDLRRRQRRARGGPARAAPDGRPDGQPDAQAAGGRPDGVDLGPVRRLHRADPFGDACRPPPM